MTNQAIAAMKEQNNLLMQQTQQRIDAFLEQFRAIIGAQQQATQQAADLVKHDKEQQISAAQADADREVQREQSDADREAAKEQAAAAAESKPEKKE